MELIYLLYLFSGFVTSLPVLVCHEFYSDKNYDIEHILIFLFTIFTIWFIITLLLYYYTYNKIKIGEFYVIIKLLEVGFTIYISIYFYNEKYNIYNYIGLVFAFITLILVSI